MCSTCKPNYQSILHYLYPGHPMQTWYSYDRKNVPNDHPLQLAEYTANQHNQLVTQVKTENQYALDEAGTYKVIQHPAVEPEATIEDPDLQYVQMDLPPMMVNGDGPVAPSGRENFTMSLTKNPNNLTFILIAIFSLIIAAILVCTIGLGGSKKS